MIEYLVVCDSNRSTIEWIKNLRKTAELPDVLERCRGADAWQKRCEAEMGLICFVTDEASIARLVEPAFSIGIIVTFVDDLPV